MCVAVTVLQEPIEPVEARWIALRPCLLWCSSSDLLVVESSSSRSRAVGTAHQSSTRDRSIELVGAGHAAVVGRQRGCVLVGDVGQII